ncbi:MAG: ABC transporter substrate-binding protein [Chloroflexi bacterium]|nr:ABC transporter substrate-binding protein [Chloroflexota bacterium]
MSGSVWPKPGFLVGVLAWAGLLTTAACGAQEPAPTPTPTTPLPAATVVATPTPAATATPTPVPMERPRQGGIIKQTSTGDPQSFDPHNAISALSNIHNQKLYSNLLWNPEGSEIVVDAADSYAISADGKVWTFKLRPDVRFQSYTSPSGPRDGTPMTSQDVKWSLEKIMGLNGQVLSPRSGWMKEFVDISRPDHGIEVMDNLTLSIHLTQPFSGLASILAIGFSAIVPEGISTKEMQQRPYGSGPFRLKGSQRGALWQYERNPDYFKPGLPYLDEWDLVLMDGFFNYQAAFLTQNVDVSGGYPIPDNETIYAKRMAAGEFYMIPTSSDCRPAGLNMNLTRPPFDNILLRQAVNLAVDREAYSVVVHNGHALPELYLNTGGWGKTEAEVRQLPGYRQPHDADLAEARRIVAELYPQGLDLKMMVSNTSVYKLQGEFLAGDLKRIGLNVTLDIVDTATVSARAAKLDYHIWSYYFCQTTNTPEELFGSYFKTSGSRNWFGFTDPQIDNDYLVMAASSDPAQRKKKAQEMEAIVYSSLPIAPLPVSLTTRSAYSYVKDLPLGISQYTREKNELVWRSDA